MVFDLSKVTGIGEYLTKTENLSKDGGGSSSRVLFLKKLEEEPIRPPVFLVDNENTIEVRCDEKLSSLLTEKYESVMKSRYFGNGGIEIVLAGNQLSEPELFDLIRLSYNLTK